MVSPVTFLKRKIGKQGKKNYSWNTYLERIMAGLRTGCKVGYLRGISSILPRLLTRKPQVLVWSHTEGCEAITEVEYEIMKGLWEGLMQRLICEVEGQICLLSCHWSCSGAVWDCWSVTRYLWVPQRSRGPFSCLPAWMDRCATTSVQSWGRGGKSCLLESERFKFSCLISCSGAVKHSASRLALKALFF